MNKKDKENYLFLLKFIKATGGKFPYPWAKDLELFDMKEVNKQIKELEEENRRDRKRK